MSSPSLGCTQNADGSLKPAEEIEWSHSRDSSPVLEQAYQWDHNYITLNLVARGDYLIVGDAINSVALLEIEGTKLKCTARDYSPLWPVAIDGSAKGDIVGANVRENVLRTL